MRKVPRPVKPRAVWMFVLLGLAGWPVLAVQAQSSSDPIGLAALRAIDPTLTGSGVAVAQPEATTFTDPTGPNPTDNNDFEVKPGTVNQPGSLFTYINSAGTVSTTFPDGTGSESGHADTVGEYFYGRNNTASPEGVAPGVSHVYNINANYFIDMVIGKNQPITTDPGVSVPVVNQSFVDTDLNDQASLDTAYDEYNIAHGTLFVSGAGNGGAVLPPSTAYNGISVGAYGGSSSNGPTAGNNKRSKPDITAPASATSFSTPQVSGAAAVLIQAGRLGRGGAGTETSAVDSRTLKALLLNGAVKPADWTHTPTAPLDTRYGAGILNVANSYLQLKGGMHGPTAFTATPVGAAHPGVAGAASVASNIGWNLGTLTSSAATDVEDHYHFTLAATASNYQFTGTLVWNRNPSISANINNLDLFLYDLTTSSQIAASISTVDNVEEISVALLPGEYDLEVLKNGGSSADSANVVSDTETYALAYDFEGVPEPSAVWLLAAGGLGTLGCLRGRRAG